MHTELLASTGLLEREGSLEILRETIREAERGRGRLVLLAAEAGGGKTALVQTFLAELPRETRVLAGACDPLFTPRPFAPFADVAVATGGALADVVAVGARPHEVLGPLVAELSARRTVLALEDLHWADEATLDLLRLLGRRVEALGTVVIGTYRDDELGLSDPLRIVIGDLESTTAVVRLHLPALTADAVAELAEPRGVDPADLYAKTGGNPFFVTEALAAGEDGIPATIRDAVLGRAARLPPAARGVLEAVAVVPQQAELWLLGALVGDAIGELDACLASGMLTAQAQSVGFRHELARLAVEESLPAHRKVELHCKALRALEGRPSIDVARVAHHAEGAGDEAAVLRYASAAGDWAGSVGARREAAAQYARALRSSAGLGPRERGELLEKRAYACYLIGEFDEAIETQQQALACHREVGDRRLEGDALRSLSRLLRYVGRADEAMAVGNDAVEVLERLEPGHELGMAYCNLSHLYMHLEDREATFDWASRALELAARLGDPEVEAYALLNTGNLELLHGEGSDTLKRALRLSLDQGFEEHAGRAFLSFMWWSSRGRQYDEADRYLDEGLEYCSERGLDIWRHFLLAYHARAQLDRGRWDEAAAAAAQVVRSPRTSPVPRVAALAILGLTRARRGDPEVWPVLDEAWALAEPTGELQRLEPAALARAEALWLQGRPQEIEQATRATLGLAQARGAWWIVGELACWRRRAGVEEAAPSSVPEPWAAELADGWQRAAELWTRLDSPYEAALARAESDDQGVVQDAVQELTRLGARPAAVIAARRLRKRGGRGVPRGPRPSTRANPAGLTARELDVLRQLAEGLRNADIAERLVISERTVDHHVSAILRKLGVRTRGEAAAAARRLGLLQDR